jgi:hypothetical protein
MLNGNKMIKKRTSVSSDLSTSAPLKGEGEFDPEDNDRPQNPLLGEVVAESPPPPPAFWIPAFSFS